jgi:hypothetical protein
MKKIRQIGEAVNSLIRSDIEDGEFKYLLEKICTETAKTCKRGTWPEVGHFSDVAEKINTRSNTQIAEKSGVSDWVLDTDKVYKERLSRGERVCIKWLERYDNGEIE